MPCLLGMMAASAQSNSKRHIQPEDVFRSYSVSNPRLSPDGQWILYNHTKVDAAKDSYDGKLYMMNIKGEETIQLTEQTKGAGQAAWSPDNTYISFVSRGKAEDAGSQIYLMNRKGGEPIQLTNVKGELQSYKWFPDGTSLLLEIREASTADTAKTKIRKPYEIDRYTFKNDSEGYLDRRKTHLYRFHLKTKKIDTLTRGGANESGAVVSSDGKKVAYVSNITTDPDLNANTDIFILDIEAANTLQVTTFPGTNGAPRFSPDSRQLAYTQSATESAFNMYDATHLYVYDITSRRARNISGSLDRSVGVPVWSADGKTVFTLIDDDRNGRIVRFDATNGQHAYITHETGAYSALETGAGGKMLALFSDAATPNEIYLADQGSFKRLTHFSDEFLAPFKPIQVTGIECLASDKNEVHGILYLPESGAKNLPLILFIHGGPVAQDEYGFDMSHRIMAGAGYAVAAVNYRGSSGRGEAYTKSIFSDWGNKEVKDILAVAEHLISTGVADPQRLAIAGWSYGGLLTNYTIATDTRFKAAVSGAGSSLQFSMYGSDQYIRQYDIELGTPWKNPKKWIDLSYPFFRVNTIKTPTMFMASEDDFNVPVIGAEQMYQAFKSNGIPTELVIYPNQHHGLRVPSYIVHRYRKHLEWFDKYLR